MPGEEEGNLEERRVGERKMEEMRIIRDTWLWEVGNR